MFKWDKDCCHEPFRAVLFPRLLLRGSMTKTFTIRTDLPKVIFSEFRFTASGPPMNGVSFLMGQGLISH